MTTDIDVSFEFFPPKTEAGRRKLDDAADALAAYAPRFMTVTYGAGGSTRETTRACVEGLARRTGLPTAHHLTCVGARREDVDALAVDLWRSGVRHVVALRGDPREGVGRGYRPHPGGYAYAADLVAGLKRVADFEISVGAYPETHPESPDPQADLDNLKRKLDAGATRAITQYFFEPELFLRFRDRARAAGIAQEIVPGILPVTNLQSLIRFSAACGATVPGWLVRRFDGLEDDPETRQMIAANQAIDLCERLRAEGVDSFHFYTLNRAPLARAVCHALGLRTRRQQEKAA